MSQLVQSVRQGCKKPVAYCLAVEVEGKLQVMRELPVFWTKKAANAARRELKKATGAKFVVAEAWIRKKA